MRKIFLFLVMGVVLGLTLLPIEGKAQMGPGMMGRGYMMGPGWGYAMGPGMMGGGGYEDWYCPYCGGYLGRSGGYGMGPGMMGRSWGYGLGPGMMGRGMGAGMMGPGMGPGMMGPGYGYGYGPQYQQPQKPLEEKDVKAILENYLQSTRNPNLKLGKVTDKGPYFEAEIVTKNNALVDKILVDKNTGWMRSEYF